MFHGSYTLVGSHKILTDKGSSLTLKIKNPLLVNFNHILSKKPTVNRKKSG